MEQKDLGLQNFIMLFKVAYNLKQNLCYFWNFPFTILEYDLPLVTETVSGEGGLLYVTF
jgi:hypothetical protein